jgi:hypothetical protein
MRDEEPERRQVGGHVDHFRCRRRVQEVETEETDEQEDQEAAGPRAKEAIIEADGATQQEGVGKLAPPRVLRSVNATEIAAREGVAGGTDQQQQDQRPQYGRGQPGHRHGTEVRAGESGSCCRQRRSPGHLDAAGIAPGGTGRAEDAGKLVRPEQGRRQLARQRLEQRGDLDQAAAADNRIDETGKQGCHCETAQQHGVESVHPASALGDEEQSLEGKQRCSIRAAAIDGSQSLAIGGEETLGGGAIEPFHERQQRRPFIHSTIGSSPLSTCQ